MVAKLGTGGRFAALKSKLSAKGGIKNPGALAASIGRKKYGASKMAKMSAAGRKKKASTGPTPTTDIMSGMQKYGM